MKLFQSDYMNVTKSIFIDTNPNTRQVGEFKRILDFQNKQPSSRGF